MLEKVFISNYLSINEKQELKVSNRLTTLIGANGSGKSSILKAINKLNGIQVQKTEKNIRHHNVGTSISAIFRLTSDKQKKMNEIRRKIFDDPFILYPENSDNDDILMMINLDESTGNLKHSFLASSGEELDLIDLSLSNIYCRFDQMISECENLDLAAKILDIVGNKEQIFNVLTLLSNEEKNELPENVLLSINKLADELSKPFDDLIPKYKFIYLDSFKNVLVDGIPVTEIKNNNTVMSFLSMIGSNADEVIDAVTRKDTQVLNSLQNAAVEIVTKDFKEINTQLISDNNFKIQMSIDTGVGKLEFWITNSASGASCLRLSDESDGMSWFLSLYLRLYDYFKKNDDDTEYILLLDEPNIYLHASAQRDLLEKVFKDKLKDVQIIYSTHSPYLIDACDPYSLRIVDKVDETKIYNTPQDYKCDGNKDINVFDPVLISLGINVNNQLLLSHTDKVLVVEGVLDYYILSAMKDILKINDDTIKIIPSYGAPKVPMLAGYLFGLGYNILAILDYDGQGNNAIKVMREKNDVDECLKAIQYKKMSDNLSGCILEELFSVNDKAKYIKDKTPVLYRKFYNNRGNYQAADFDKETIENFKYIFDVIVEKFARNIDKE